MRGKSLKVLFRHGHNHEATVVELLAPAHHPLATIRYETTGKSVIYQPVAAAANTTGSFRAVGGGGGDPHDPREGARRLEAGLCVRVDDSAWSRPLNIAVQGAGGPFQVYDLPHLISSSAFKGICVRVPYLSRCTVSARVPFMVHRYCLVFFVGRERRSLVFL